MDKNDFFHNIRKEANAALSKVFDKVEEVSKVSGLRLRINKVKSKIRGIKKEIGDIVYKKREEFQDFSDIKELTDKIDRLEEDIKLKKEQIDILQEKEEKEKEKEKDNPSDTFSL